MSKNALAKPVAHHWAMATDHDDDNEDDNDDDNGEGDAEEAETDGSTDGELEQLTSSLGKHGYH